MLKTCYKITYFILIDNEPACQQIYWAKTKKKEAEEEEKKGNTTHNKQVDALSKVSITLAKCIFFGLFSERKSGFDVYSCLVFLLSMFSLLLLPVIMMFCVSLLHLSWHVCMANVSIFSFFEYLTVFKTLLKCIKVSNAYNKIGVHICWHAAWSC